MKNHSDSYKAEFIRAWNSADDPMSVADQFGLTLPQTRYLSRSLRKEGHQLKRFREYLDNFSFAETWNSSASYREVSERTGLTRNGCHVKASKLRAKGYELKRMKKEKTK